MKTGFWNLILMLVLIAGGLSAPSTTQPNEPSPRESAPSATELTPKGQIDSSPVLEHDPIAAAPVLLTDVLTEGFEDGIVPPTGWSVINTHAWRNWRVVSAAVHSPELIHSGTFAALVHYDTPAASDEWLLTPDIDLTDIADASLSFWALSDTNWCPNSNFGATVFLHVTNSSGTPVATVWDMCNDESWLSLRYRQVHVDLSAFAGQTVRLAWQYVGIDGQFFGLDGVSLTGTRNDVGWLKGYVVDAETGGTAPACTDAIVSIDDGQSARVNVDGSFGPVTAIAGTHIATATAPGFSVEGAALSVVEDMTTTQSIGLWRPVIEVTPTDLRAVSTSAGEPATYTLTVANKGREPLHFEIQELAPSPVVNTLSGFTHDPGIEVEPQLLEQLKSDETAGYMIYLHEKPDLSPAFAMDWHERGWFVVNALRETAERSQARVRAVLDAQGAQYRSFWIDNVIAVESSNRVTFSSLIDFPEIAALRAERTMRMIEPVEKAISSDSASAALELNISHVGANQVWNLGHKGEGMVVANIDTGVRYTHDALVEQYRGNLNGGSFNHDYNWLDAFGGTIPIDDYGHGTHTMGIMVGGDGGYNQIGVAPNAQWIACKGCSGGYCPATALLTCAQWIAAPYPIGDPSLPNPDRRPHVVNNSWSDCGWTYDDWYQSAVDAWHAVGIYPIFASGNAPNCGYSSPPPCNTVGNPARYGNVTGVGSTGQFNGEYAAHSNWGPTDNADIVNPRGYANAKPQVVAPGIDIRSSFSGSDSDYVSWGGTSMSAPHVSGLVALMWHAAPCVVGDYAATETLIEEAARAIPYATACGGEGPENAPNHATGWGEIDALETVQAAMDYCASDWLPWVTPDSAGGTVPASSSVDIDLIFNCTQKNDLAGTLKVIHNDPCGDSVEVPISLHCQSSLSADWDKWIDGEPWAPGITLTRETTDTIEVIDVVRSTPPFTLTEVWNPAHLDLTDWKLDPPAAGSVTTVDGQLRWTRLSGPAEPVTLTKLFHVETCTWAETILGEELRLDGGFSEERIVTIEKETPLLWIDANYEPEVGAGENVTFTLLYGNSGGYENDVQVRNYFVPEARFLSSHPLPDRMSITGSWAEWDVGALAKDNAGSIDVTVAIADGLVPSTTVEFWDYIYNHVGAKGDAVKIAYHIADTNCKPVTGVDFDWSPVSPQTGEIVTFTPSPVPPTATLPIAYEWSFGDGGTASGNPVYHTYVSGGLFSVNVTANNPCGGPAQISHDVSVSGTAVTPNYGVELTPAADNQRGLRDTNASYTLTVRNKGNTADTFEMDAVNLDGWSTEVTPALVNLLPDTTGPVVVSVSIPPNADAGDVNIATVTATSQGNPLIGASSTLTTTVWESNYFLPLVFRNF